MTIREDVLRVVQARIGELACTDVKAAAEYLREALPTLTSAEQDALLEWGESQAIEAERQGPEALDELFPDPEERSQADADAERVMAAAGRVAANPDEYDAVDRTRLVLAGCVYRCRPLSIDDFLKLDELASGPGRFSDFAAALDAYRTVTRIARRYLRPEAGVQRLFWRLRPNPFARVTEAEVGALLLFLLEAGVATQDGRVDDAG